MSWQEDEVQRQMSAALAWFKMVSNPENWKPIKGHIDVPYRMIQPEYVGTVDSETGEWTKPPKS